MNNNNINNNNNLRNEALKAMNVVRINSSGVLSIMALSHFKYPKTGEQSNIYASTVFALTPAKSTVEEVEYRLDFFHFKCLYVFDIVEVLKGDKGLPSKRIFTNYMGNSKMILNWIDFDTLFSENFLSDLSDLCAKEKDVNIVFISHSFTWSLIKTGLKKFNINLNSGNNTLKRVLTPNQFLLSKVVMLLYGFETNIVSNSFAVLARNKALSRGIFDYTNKDCQIFLKAFPYGDIDANSLSKDTSKNKSENTSNNKPERGNYSKNSSNISSVGSNNSTSNIKSNNSTSNIKKRGFHSKRSLSLKGSATLPKGSTLIKQHLLKSELAHKPGDRFVNDLNMMRSFSTSLPCSGALKNYLIEQMDDNWDDYNLDEDTWMAPYLSDRKEADRKEMSLGKLNQINKLDSIKKDKRTVDPKSGLYRKTGITKWVKNNYYNKLIPKPDMLFIGSFIDFNSNSSLLLRSNYSKTAFRDFYYVGLYYYKLNNTAVKSNYYLYLINTPDNLLYSFCLEQIEYYYGHLYNRTVRGNGKMFIAPCKEYKYELVSLYHDLGKRLVWYCLKYMYTQYVDYFKNLSITGEPYKKYTINVKDRNLELDFFLSFTDFKNILIKELFDLDTGDLIKYGKDMYIFTLFNIYLFNSISNKVKDYNNNLELKVDSKALVNVIKPKLGYLGWYYPSRNEMNKSIIKLGPFNNAENIDAKCM